MTVEKTIFQPPIESSAYESLEKIISVIHDVKLDVQEQLKRRGVSASICDIKEPKFVPKVCIAARGLLMITNLYYF